MGIVLPNPKGGAGIALLLICFTGAGGTLLWLSGQTVNPVTYEISSLAVPGLPDQPVPGVLWSLMIPFIALATIAALAIQRARVARRTRAVPFSEAARGASHPQAPTRMPAGVDNGPLPNGRGTESKTLFLFGSSPFGGAALPLLATSVAGLALALSPALALRADGEETVGGLWRWIGEVFPFAMLCISAIGIGWSVARLGEGLPIPVWFRRIDRLAPVLVGTAILAGTAFHAIEQHHFWTHFMLGYADFGLFTTELEHCLPYKDVGAVRFADTRMGYHCVPMFYLLAPLYALFRTPVFLMVVGPLALNLAAIPFYQLARDRSGVPLIGLVVALAYLALPSLSRLPYSNTYGFQSIYLAVPWLAFSFCLAMRGRWRWSHLCLAGAMLCEETVCGVAFGWGLYLVLFGGRRRDGLVIVSVSILYLLLCTTIVIPAFAQSSDYSRLMLFGDLSLANALGRLVRPRVLLYLLALGVPLLLGLSRSIKLLIVILPSLLLVVLLQQSDYLNLKYWHQTSILVGLFVAAAMGVTASMADAVRRSDGEALDNPAAPDSGSVRHLRATAATGGGRYFLQRPSNHSYGLAGRTLGLLMTVLIIHQFLGHSPLTQSQRIYAAHPGLRQPDPRLGAVEWVRENFPANGYTVIATERMAAHFVDYRMVISAPRVRMSDTMSAAHVLVFDLSDGWDETVMKNRTNEFLDHARRAGFVQVHRHGPVVVLTNRPGAADSRPTASGSGVT